jgi:hypothetical protein
MDVERASSSYTEHQVGLTRSEITSFFRSEARLADDFFEHQHRRIFLEGEKRLMFAILEDDINNPKFQGLFQTIKLLRDEYGFEAFYNAAITPWLLLTPDIQVVRGAQREVFTTGTGPLGLPSIATRKSIGTATILGLRCKSYSSLKLTRNGSRNLQPSV